MNNTKGTHELQKKNLRDEQRPLIHNATLRDSDQEKVHQGPNSKI